jgi:hypothetical protein
MKMHLLVKLVERVYSFLQGEEDERGKLKMRTRNSQIFYNMINEQKKWWNVEVEYDVSLLIQPQTLTVHLDGSTESFGSKSVKFSPVQVNIKGRKTFEVEASSEGEARKRFEDLNSNKDWEASLYVGDEYISGGFESRVENAEVKVISIEESE